MSQQEDTSCTQNNSTKKKSVQDVILNALKYIGFIGAGILIVAYIAVIMVFIEGLKVMTSTQDILFACVNGVIGLLIMQMLKVQGESFAKHLPENKKIADEYYNTKTKDKKLRSMKFYWLTSTIKDFIFKAGSIVFTTAGIIYIVIEGTHDYGLLLIGIINALLFLCFGLIALSSTYEFYNNHHVPYMKAKN